MTATALLALALLLTPNAQAAKLKKMSNAELAALVQDTGAKEDDRVEAAGFLADRGAVADVAALGAACAPSDSIEVCEHALAALEDLRHDDAWPQVEGALRLEGLDEGLRIKAFRILSKEDPERLDTVVPELLEGYRKLPDRVAVRSVEWLPERDLRRWQDITVLMATDRVLSNRVRLAAEEAATDFAHPRLYQVWVSMLSDPEERIRKEAAISLGRSGLPSSIVREHLVQTASQDEAGGVRAKAWKSLRFHAHPDLLPAIHEAVLTEKNPIAWGHAIELLEVLADDSSVSTLGKLLERQEYLLEEGVIRLVHTAVRIGDASIVPALEALERSTTVEAVRTEARAAIDLLKGPEAQRTSAVSSYQVIDYYVVEPADEPVQVELSVSIGEDGMAVWATTP